MRSSTKTARRPSKTSEEQIAEVVDYILSEMVERGRTMVDICGDKDMPNRSTVYRWLADRPVFRARVDAASEAIADHLVNKARQVADNSKPETANADRIKLVHLHWEAARMAPRKYSERRLAEITGKDGGPIQVGNNEFDASRLTPEERDQVRTLLMKAKGAN